MQRERRVNRPGSASYFSKAFPFHAGRPEPAAFRAPFRLRGRRTFSEFHYNVIRNPRAVAARPPGARAEGIYRRDADPGAGDPDPPEGPRPARHRPDRHRQDRRLHAAVDRPAAPQSDKPRRSRAPAGCWCSRRPASSPARSPRAPAPTASSRSMRGRHRVRRHLDRQEPPGRGARRRRPRRHAGPADRPDRAALPDACARSRSSSSTRPTRCSTSASSTRSSRS